ncbi:hypothetical protein BGZ76_002114 [Entomortierella beljakovae]|nr:hypothetical protein BGZ76_002114 [Entomortierella beljakovae]
MIEATSAHFNSGFSQTMITLSSHFDMRRSINLSRSSSTSTMTCIDPNALILNNQGSPVASSRSSTPASRRHSSFSISGETETEDELQAEMRSMFEENFSLSSNPSLTPNNRPVREYRNAAQSLARDLIMPDVPPPQYQLAKKLH